MRLPHLRGFSDQLNNWRDDLKVLDRVMVPDEPVRTHASFVVEHGRPGLQSA